MIAVPAAILLVAMAAAGGWWWNSAARERRARALIAATQAEIDRDDMDGAYRLGREALAILPDDPRLKQLWINLTLATRLDSSPPGADVAVKGYLTSADSWIPLGRTPIEKVYLPLGQVVVRVTKEGFVPFEGTARGIDFKYVLDPVASMPPGMVRVGGSLSEVDGNQVNVDDYWLDRYEVTNRQFKTFVDSGGYRSADPGRSRLPVKRGRSRGRMRWRDSATPRRAPDRRPGSWAATPREPTISPSPV